MVEDSGAMPRLYKDSYYFEEALICEGDVEFFTISHLKTIKSN